MIYSKDRNDYEYELERDKIEEQRRYKKKKIIKDIDFYAHTSNTDGTVELKWRKKKIIITKQRAKHKKNIISSMIRNNTIDDRNENIMPI